VLLLLLAFGLAVVAVASTRSVDEEDVKAVTDHALLAERDPNVILALEHALSAAGRLAEAELMRDRWQSLTQELFHDIEVIAAPVAPQGGTIVTATAIDPRMQRALEWSKMYGISVEEALRRMAERGL
jgi:hypothetical protein